MNEWADTVLSAYAGLLFNSKDKFDYDFFAVRDLINNIDNSLSCFTQVLKSILSLKLK